MSKDHRSLRNDASRILAKKEAVSNNTWRTGRNNNDLVIGPTGAGKTRSYVKPNLLQASESLIITDTKGNLYEQTAPALEAAGYEIQLLDFTRPERSIGYNPFDFIAGDKKTGYSQQDIAAMAEALYGGSAGQMSKDPYWDEAAKGLLRSLISCVLESIIVKEHTIDSVLSLFELVEITGERGETESPYVRILRKLQAEDPASYAAAQYFSVMNERVEKTASCIKMILGAQLSQFANRDLSSILAKQERVDLKRLARRRTALFLVISDMDRSQDKLANLFYTQALQELCRYADRECKDQCLPVPVRFILDDFATNARIPDFDKTISVIRSRGIAVSIILQSLTQLEHLYGPMAARTIVNGCDSLLYLGGMDLATARYIGTRADVPDHDVLSLPLEDSWLMIRGQKPRIVQKYELEDHPRYHLLPEAGCRQRDAGSEDNVMH